MSQADAERILRIGEHDKIGFIFSGEDLLDGIFVSGGTVSVLPTPGLSLDSATALITATADGVYAWITGVTAGEYDVTFAVDFTDGRSGIKKIYRIFVPTEALSGLNIVTVEEAKAHLQSGGAVADQSIVEQAIDAISARLAKKIGTLSLRLTTYAAMTLDGWGRKFLDLPAWPVTELTSITEDGVALVENTDFYVDYEWGTLERADGKWTTTRRAIVVSFKAGYVITGTVTLPRDLRAVALNEIARMVMNIKNSIFGETSRSLEGVTISFNTDEFTPDTLATLGRYKRYRL